MANSDKRKYQLKQMAVVGKDFDSNVADFIAVLDLQVCFNDPGVGKFGLINALFAFGETFLEIVVPNQPDTTAGRLLEKRKGDGGYMVLVQTDDFSAYEKYIQTTGVRIIWQSEQPQAIAAHLHPKDVGGAILSVDQMIPPDYWHWAGPQYKDKQGSTLVNRIIGAVIQGNDPQEVAKKWARAFDLPIEAEGEEFSLQLDEGVIRFIRETDGRGPGVEGIILDVKNVDEIIARAIARNLTVDDQSGINSVTICGTKFYLSP